MKQDIIEALTMPVQILAFNRVEYGDPEYFIAASAPDYLLSFLWFLCCCRDLETQILPEG